MTEQPNEKQRAGRVRWKRPPTPYERFMEEEGIPVVRGIGLRDVRELPLSPWVRAEFKRALAEAGVAFRMPE